MEPTTTDSFSRRQRRHVAASITWLLVASALFLALLVVASEENYLFNEDAYLQALVNLIVCFAVLTWAITAIYIVQRKRPGFLATAPPGARHLAAGVIITACIAFTTFITIAYNALGSYLTGDLAWATYLVFGLLGAFLAGGAWHVARLAKPGLLGRARAQRPFTRKGGKAAYIALCVAMLAGTGTLFTSLWVQAGDPVVPHVFTLEAGSTNTSVILLIGDGMGFPHIELGRLVEFGPGTNASVDRFPHKGNVSTSNIDGGTTDSAAAATALATGVRTQNGRISQSWDGQNLTTILDIAKARGYATGLVAVCQLAHATPAAFAANQPNRDMYTAIASDMVARRVDVMLGGGRDAKYLGTHVEELAGDGYAYVTNKTALATVAGAPVLGLFAGGNLPRAQEYTDTTTAPTLLEMVETGIELLNGTGRPFFLMVEASAIDWAGHANDKVYTAHEMIEFDRVINHTINLAMADPKLQVLLTADHETGGLSILGHQFTTPVPTGSDTLAEQIAKRTARAGEVQVSWSTGGHTNDNVILAGIGPYTSQLGQARYNIDVFSLMRMAIEGQSGPVVDGINDGYRTVEAVIIAFWGMLGTAIALAALYAWQRVKRPS